MKPALRDLVAIPCSATAARRARQALQLFLLPVWQEHTISGLTLCLTEFAIGRRNSSKQSVRLRQALMGRVPMRLPIVVLLMVQLFVATGLVHASDVPLDQRDRLLQQAIEHSLEAEFDQ